MQKLLLDLLLGPHLLPYTFKPPSQVTKWRWFAQQYVIECISYPDRPYRLFWEIAVFLGPFFMAGGLGSGTRLAQRRPNVFHIRIALIASSEKSQFLWELSSWQAASDRAPDWSKGGQKKHRSEILFQKKHQGRRPWLSSPSSLSSAISFGGMVAISTKLTDTKKGCGSNHVKPESASEKKRSRLKTLNHDIVSFPMSKRKDKFCAWSFNLSFLWTWRQQMLQKNPCGQRLGNFASKKTFFSNTFIWSLNSSREYKTQTA